MQKYFCSAALKSALKRIIKYFSLNIDSVIFLELDYDESNNFQDKLLKYFLKKDNKNIPHCIIFSYKKRLFSSNIEETSKIELFLRSCPEYYHCFNYPFHLSELLGILRDLPQPRKNPFLKIEKIWDAAGNLLNVDPNPKILGKDIKSLLTNIGKISTEDGLAKFKKSIYHGMEKGAQEEEETKFVNKMNFQILQCAYANVLNQKSSEPFRVLLIENYSDKELISIDERYKTILKDKELKDKTKKMTMSELLINVENCFENYHFFLYDGDGKKGNPTFADLKKQIGEKSDTSLEIEVKELSNPKNTCTIKIENFNFILIDVFLEDSVNGVDLLKLFTAYYPKIPSFILSMSDDFEIVSDTIKEGADFFIHKSQLFSLPYTYYRYIQKLGLIFPFIFNKKYEENLIGNIRYWKFKRDLLWFGDKCYHMINHSYQHTLNDWNKLNEILVPLLRENNNLFDFRKNPKRKETSESKEDKNGTHKEKKRENEEWLYSLCMAVWLHDIGHKGNERYGAAYLIRDNHGYISAEYILKSPKLFGIKEDGKNDEYYENIKFTPSDPGSAVEILYKRIQEKKQLSNAEKIALLCAYHKSNMPLTDEDYYKLKSDPNKIIPIDFFMNGERKADNIITLEKILNRVYDDDSVKKLIGLFALFRLIDGLDNHISRVGDESEKKLKLIVIENDRDYEISAIEKNVATLVKLYCKTPAEKALFVQRYDEDLKREIKEGAVVNFKSLEKLFPNQEEFENYLLHAYYASFISIQPTHFDFHSSIEDLEIIYLGKKKFKFVIKTSKDKETLKNMKVKERGRKDTSVFDRLIGENDCYVLKELNSGKKYLLNHWINGVEIELQNIQVEEPIRRKWPKN